jgi:UDP-glucose 4-epimerase
MANQVLVTGGAGFIGTHLCRVLVQRGRKVHVLDLKDPATTVAGVDYLKGDVRNVDTVKKAVQGVDAVFHLAAIASVPHCQEQPFESTQTNLVSTALLMENLKPGTRFVFAGSSAVYGDSGKEGESFSEDRPIENLASFYAAQKFGSETLIQQFKKSRGIPATVFRFFNVYGPGQSPKSPYTGVITTFYESIKAGRPLLLNGGGVQTRDFISVHDIVRALNLAIEVPAEVCDAQPINLGTGQSVTIRKLAETMKDVSHSQVTLQDAPWREGDVCHSTAKISRAFEKLGWKPSISLEKGLKELLNPAITHP